MTRKLFYEDSHQSCFDAVVVSCEKSSHGYDVILDQTCFYPEGGGQPGDIGTLNGIPVTDTHEKNGDVIHYCTDALEVGMQVHGVLDYDRRFDYMQQHSGEHILSGLIHAAFGYENVGFHMGSDFVTVDFSGPMSMEQVRRLEQKANEFVWKNVPVEVTYPDARQLKTIPYRSKKELSGWVRIVTVPGADICACCGTHVAYTGEIGIIKVFSCVKFHEGVRLEMLCGRKAYAYLAEAAEQNRLVSGLLSARPMETAENCSRLLAECADLKYRVQKLEDQNFAGIAKHCHDAGDTVLFEDNLTPDGARKLADAVMQTCGGMAAVFSGSDTDGYLYAIGQADGDLRMITKELNAAFDGRGGGKPFFVQGRIKGTKANIEAFFKTARNKC